jgi:hypothetical protein
LSLEHVIADKGAKADDKDKYNIYNSFKQANLVSLFGLLFVTGHVLTGFAGKTSINFCSLMMA